LRYCCLEVVVECDSGLPPGLLTTDTYGHTVWKRESAAELLLPLTVTFIGIVHKCHVACFLTNK